jgi:lipopolysaccharide export system protein LptC
MLATRLIERTRPWLPLLPLILLLAATYWLNQQVQPLPQGQTQVRHDIDYYVDNFTATSLNLQGQPRYTLAAEKMWHYPDDDTTHLQMPKLANLYQDRPPVLTTSETGMISSKGDDVYLYDNVHISRPASPGFPKEDFSTDYLHVIPDRDWAETDKSVVLTGPNNELRAVGMELDYKARTVKLLSRVSATHEPVPR